MEAAGWGRAIAGVVNATARRPGGRSGAAVRRRRRWCRGWPARPTSSTRAARARRRVRPGRPVRLAAARPGQRAADRPQLLHRRPAGGAVPAGLADRPGDGRLAGASATSTTPATTRGRSASRSGAPRAMRTSGDDIAEVLALLGVRPEWDEASRRVSDLHVVPPGGARPPADRRDRADLRLLPRRLPARGRRCSTTPSGWSPSLDEPRRPQLRPRPRPGRPRRARRRAPRDHPHLRLQARRRTAPASCS